MLVTDQMGYEVEVPLWTDRIVSLVPSQTELLFDLGLENRIVGVTKFCIHPAKKVKNKAKIGGTKNFNFAQIDAVQPNLILGNKEENYQAGILQLKEKYPVWLSDIATLPQALEMMQQIGVITNTADIAQNLTQKITSSFQKLNAKLPVSTAYFIWREPYMTVGQDTFIHQILHYCGFQNVFANSFRYPEITTEQIRAVNPKLILLSSEPYPFKEKHLQEFQSICPHAFIKLVDGEMFSWYGSRLQYAAAYLQRLIVEVAVELS